jgi:serine/threonine protein kinase
MYILLSGQFPFEGSSNASILRSVLKGDFNIKHGMWKHISSPAKDLIKRTLTKSPASRITAEAALTHSWFDQATSEMITIDPSILQSLRQYKAQSRMQKEAMSVLVKLVDVKELKDLKR